MFIKKTIWIGVLLLSACISNPEYVPFENDVKKTDVSPDLGEEDMELDLPLDLNCGGTCTDEQRCVNNECVSNECGETNDSCLDAAESKCVANQCEQCEADSDCSHIDGFPRCDEGCKVECELDIHCMNGKICDLTQGANRNTCQAVPTDQNQCQRCISDSQCKDGYRCVEVGEPNAEPQGTFCLQISTVITPCAPPYSTAVNRKSLGNAELTEYCSINESVTTCDAVIAMGADIDCQRQGINEGDQTKCPSDGGLCILRSQGRWRCTSQCGGNQDCNAGDTCPPIAMRYCQ